MHRLQVLTVVIASVFLSLLCGCAAPSGQTPTALSGQTPAVPSGQTPTAPSGQTPATPSDQTPAVPSGQAPATPPGGADWRFDFDLSPDDLSTTGRNPFFILEPGFQLILEGGGEKVSITVLNETETVGAFTTRVVEEREEKNGELHEVSRNYFAISKTTGDVFYFGETVDIYQNGEVVRHEGAWRADEADAKPGLIMPGNPTIGMKYYQEVAPGKAMDRAEVVSLDETLTTPAGVFHECLKTQETTPLNPLENEYKTYAPDIGLIQDERLLLTNYGFVELEN